MPSYGPGYGYEHGYGYVKPYYGKPSIKPASLLKTSVYAPVVENGKHYSHHHGIYSSGYDYNNHYALSDKYVAPKVALYDDHPVIPAAYDHEHDW